MTLTPGTGGGGNPNNPKHIHNKKKKKIKTNNIYLSEIEFKLYSVYSIYYIYFTFCIFNIFCMLLYAMVMYCYIICTIRSYTSTPPSTGALAKAGVLVHGDGFAIFVFLEMLENVEKLF